VAAERADAGRFIVCADEKLTAFVELERAIYEFAVGSDHLNHFGIAAWSVKEAESAA
jgi:hypothetical protein